MDMFNFSAGEASRIHRALGFLGKNEVDLDQFSERTMIVKTENFEDECTQLAAYYPNLGLENGHARLVFNTARNGGHKILLNKASISGLSYIHALMTEVVHLGNLSQYGADHGNIYRFAPEQAIADYYYEFLLWTKFQAMRIATRAHALVSWHEVNGEAPPTDGRYQFAQVTFAGDALRAGLQRLAEATDSAVWREGFWEVLEELARYLGQLAFYQQTSRPADVDAQFPEALIEMTVGLQPCLSLYASLQQARDYPGWQEQKQNLRRAIVAMEAHGKQSCAS
jgi:hypothetical protein